MTRLSVCMPFYRNSGMLARQYVEWATYPESVKAQIEIVLVDDGSPEPAVDVPRLEGLPPLRIYRVLEDRPWHQHGARNLAARVADGPWLLLTDMDHVVPATTLETVLGVLRLIGPSSDRDVFMFHRLDAPHLTPKLKDGKPHPHTNTFMVRKDQYWAVGGYDEDCQGYGTDAYFLKRLKANGVTFLDNAHIVRFSRDVIPDASCQNVDRVAERRKVENARLLAQKAREGRGPTILNFPWALAWPV